MTTPQKPAPDNPMARLIDIARRLDAAQINYSVSKYLDDGVSIIAVLPGERWEIDFRADGQIVVEVFRSAGECRGEEALMELFHRN